MTVDIPIGTDYRIQSDEYSYIVNKKRIVKKKVGGTEEVWGSQNKYPKSVKAACEMILADKPRSSDAKSLRELIEVTESVEKLIEESLQVNGVVI